jgi:hypothetical protein
MGDASRAIAGMMQAIASNRPVKYCNGCFMARPRSLHITLITATPPAWLRALSAFPCHRVPRELIDESGNARGFGLNSRAGIKA